MPLFSMPLADVGADAGSGPRDPHPAVVAGHVPLTFMDDDHIADAAWARV